MLQDLQEFINGHASLPDDTPHGSRFDFAGVSWNDYDMLTIIINRVASGLSNECETGAL